MALCTQSTKAGIAAICLIIPCWSQSTARERAVCYIRGFGAKYNEWPLPIRAIRETYPNIPLVELQIGDGSGAATKQSIHTQLEEVFTSAKNSPELKDKLVTVIGSSQGGLVALALISVHGHQLPFTIDSAMTIASPLAGVYGLPHNWKEMLGDTIEKLSTSFTGPLKRVLESNGMKFKEPDPFASLRNSIRTIMEKEIQQDFSKLRFLFYNPIGQKTVSIAGYWHDPLHIDSYLTYNTFLPIITNEAPNPDSTQHTKNINALRLLVFFSVGLEEVVNPPCSSERRFFKDGSATELDASFKESKTYRENLLNLGTMFDQGRLIIEHIPETHHSCYSSHCWYTVLKYFEMILNQTK